MTEIIPLRHVFPVHLQFCSNQIVAQLQPILQRLCNKYGVYGKIRLREGGLFERGGLNRIITVVGLTMLLTPSIKLPITLNKSTFCYFPTLNEKLNQVL